MAATLDVSVVTLDRWLVPSAGIIGKQKFFTCRDVLDNRLTDQRKKLERATSSTQVISNDLDEVKLAKLQEETRRLKLQNAILDGRSLPAWAVTDILTAILSQSGVIFDTLSANIQRKFPELEKRIIDGIDAAVIQHMNEVARLDEHVESILESVIAEAADKVR